MTPVTQRAQVDLPTTEALPEFFTPPEATRIPSCPPSRGLAGDLCLKGESMFAHWNHINHLLNEVSDAANTSAWRTPSARAHQRQTRSWADTDIVESEDALIVTMDLPGLSAEDIDVVVEDGVLNIRGKRPQPEREGVTVHRRERPFGEFHRTLKLGRRLDAKATEADVDLGVLRVTIPKSQESKALRVEVR